MSQIEDAISSVLSDPQQMERISALAQKLMGAGEDQPPPQPQGGEAVDPELLRRIGSLMGGTGQSSQAQAMLQAIEPYLSQKRRQKMGRALKLARLARLAGIAMEQLGGEDR